MGADVVHTHDVWVGQLAGERQLLFEARYLRFVVAASRGKDLDGDLFVDLEVSRAVDRSHSTPTDRSRLLDWQRCHPQSVQLLHAESREEANREDFSRVLDEATGVWFSGGKQGYLVSVYENTPVIDRIKKLIDRGGVVGGTSAGAAIASTPMLIYDRMQDGFEFLPGTIIDQHFLTKGRLPRLQTALANYPSFVGFGIDEATALVVRGNQFEVLGDSTVTVCLANLNNQEQYVRALKPGDKGDLLALRQLAKSRH